MKVKCIKDIRNGLGELLFKKDNIYEVIWDKEKLYRIKNELGSNFDYGKSSFTVIEDRPKEYFGDEVLIMIRSGELKVGDKYKRICDNMIFKIGSIEPNIQSLAKDKFTILEREYMIFNEARKYGTPKHKDYGFYYLSETWIDDAARKFVREMDIPIWYVE